MTTKPDPAHPKGARPTQARGTRGRPTGEKRERADPIIDWLGFIRPHLDRYASKPAGEQKRYVTELSQKVGTNTNTLRRFMSAAKFLESAGVTELPPGIKFLPVASVEVVSRISKHDPALGQKRLQELLLGVRTIQSLKDELAKIKTRRVRPSRTEPGGQGIARDELLAELSRLDPDHPPGEIVLTDFLSATPLAGLFDRTAHPRLVARFRHGRKAAVFDESTIMWSLSAERARREFVRSIALATALFDWVVVYCVTLKNDVERLETEMRKTARERLRVHVGRLASDR